MFERPLNYLEDRPAGGKKPFVPFNEKKAEDPQAPEARNQTHEKKEFNVESIRMRR